MNIRLNLAWNTLLALFIFVLSSGHPDPADAAAPAGGTVDPLNGKLCYKCHSSKLKGTYVHTALAEKECTPCHNTTGGNHHVQKGLYGVIKKGAALCYDCHEDMSNGKSVHGPIKEGNCLVCHSPHAADNKKLLKEASPDLCFGCHDKKAFKNKVPHAPVAAGDCLECHGPHQGKAGKLIKQAEPLICFNCHDASLAKGTSVHMPVSSGECDGCHAVHGGNNGKLLKTPFPAEATLPFAESSFALCFTCHDSKTITEKETETATGFRDGKQNLHTVHVMTKDGISCRVCHEFHAGQQAGLMRVKSRGTGTEVTITFARTDTGGSCTVSCHDPLSYARKGK